MDVHGCMCMFGWDSPIIERLGDRWFTMSLGGGDEQLQQLGAQPRYHPH